MKFFIADTHFCHKNSIEFNNRPFCSIEEMNKTLINNWNNVVKSEDEVFILGDFLVRGSGTDANEILRKLNGKKYLIKGNHDHYVDDKEFDSSLFEWIKSYYVFKEDNMKIILFHYPILEWEGYYKQSIHLYGHVHNNRSDYYRDLLGSRAFNVGVDAIGYKPISLEEIFNIVRLEKDSIS